MPSAELHDLTLAEAARLISVRKLSPVELTEACSRASRRSSRS